MVSLCNVREPKIQAMCLYLIVDVSTGVLNPYKYLLPSQKATTDLLRPNNLANKLPTNELANELTTKQTKEVTD